ncbi:ATP-binding protein [Pseudoalteromonas sp. SSDWG2]|uniref:ATP-binding protein n=1 Tax=Pseudoalteromonas sp. SSDWG2 TaxID=3139391 RepID=UPI003BAB9C28
MTKNGSTTSIRKALIYAIMSVATLTLFISITISTYIDMREQQTMLKERINTLAGLIAYDAQITVLFDDNKSEEERLKALESEQAIKNVHIYKIADNGVSFFASYNAKSTPPVRERTDKEQLALLSKGVLADDHYEIIRDITFDGEVVGHVYIRATLEKINNYVDRKIIIDLILSIAVLILAYAIARLFHYYVGQPINDLSQLLQNVAKDRNYKVQAPDTKITELNQLCASVNTMLERTEKHIERHEMDKKEIEALNHSLEEKVSMRTDALRDANQELLSTLERMHQYQNQIVENEKMASLGQMVAGVAHEVNTPLGLGITASTLVRDRLGEIRTAFDNKTLTSVQLGRFLIDGEENLSLIYRNLNRAADLVASFKKLAVTQDNEKQSDIDVHSLINDVLTSMNEELAQVKPEVIVDCPPDLHINAKAGPIQQILQQLISNAMTHAFDKVETARIEIRVTAGAGKMQIDFIDNGRGIAKTLQPRIFDPFVTTNRGSGGSGLGLHLVYNLATQALSGSVYLERSDESGSHFIVQLPYTEVK